MKSMYDDVLPLPKKLSTNSLAPRHSDYTEIFGGFHGSRGRSSSIPVLDLPPTVDHVDLSTISTSDYSDVFSAFHAVQFAPEFQDLLNDANGRYDDDSDEAWSPAHSGSMSDETDPSAFSERSRSTTNGDLHHHIMNGINQFNLSYHKAHQSTDGDVTTGMPHITHLHAVPGYTCIVEEKVALQNNKDETIPYRGTTDPNHKEDFGVRVADDKSYTENFSLPMNNDFQKRGSRLNRWETRSKSGPIMNEPLITVSDISLRTRPSHLPPPSRPPPVLAVGRGDPEITHPNSKTSRSLSVASLEDALCRTEGNLRNLANSTVLQDEHLQTFMNLQMEDDTEYLSSHKDAREEFTETPFDLDITVGHTVQWSQAEVTSLGTREEMKIMMNTREVVSDGLCGELEINLNENSGNEKHRKNHSSSLGSYKSEEIGLWREAAEYFEVETDFCSKDYKECKKDTIVNTDLESFENQRHRKAATKQKESCDEAILAKMALEREEKEDKLNRSDSSVKYVPEEGKSRETLRPIFQMEDHQSVQVIGGTIAPETNKDEQRVMYEEIKKVLYAAKSMETRDEVDSQHENGADTELDIRGRSERTEKISDANSEKGSEMVSEEVFEIDHLMKRNNESEKTDAENKAKDRQDLEEREKQQNELLKRSKKIQKETHVRIGPKTSKAVEQKDEESSFHHIYKQVDVHHTHEQYKKGSELSLSSEEEKKMVKACHKLDENEMERQRSFEQDNFVTEQKEPCQRENGEKLGPDPGTKVYEMKSQEALDQERSSTSSSRDFCEEGAQKNSVEASGVITKEDKGEDTGSGETSTQKTKMDELKKNMTNKGFDRSRSSPLEINEKLTHEVPSIEEVSCSVKGRHNKPDKNLGLSQQVSNSRVVVNSAEQGHPVSPTASINVSEKPFQNVAKILPHMVASDLEAKVTFPKVQRDECIARMQVSVDDKRERLRKPQLASEWVDNAKNISDALQTVLVDIGDVRDDYETEATQGTETKVNNVSFKTSRNDAALKHENFLTTKEERTRAKEREKDLIAKTQKVGGLKRRELHDEHLKRIEEEREREREREKDRTAVENTTREARGRAYVDARERAALERATSEARQRAMAEARERLEKASAEAREARLKAERAAVERATAEARQRAFEKTKAAKCPETNDRVDRAADKFPSKEIKQSGPTYDSYNIQMQNGKSITNSSAQAGVEGESPQRCKARMERYQRTAERAAKALAEKNMRDLVAQREQEERARLAEILDADVKRWSNGKEGNLRALLSTLQYILGPDSGWQPIPLTEVITSAAVKRVYRRATLCVHPDKLQQRGANTQQKYICEKVFDLLKEAWNKFNSEER